MGVMNDKYRGTKVYFIVKNELITAARYRGTVIYKEIAHLMGLPLSGNYMGLEIGRILGEISEDEFLQDRPLLSAVAVGASEEPGDGFYVLARELGKHNDDSTEGKKCFWQTNKQYIFECSQKHVREFGRSANSFGFNCHYFF